MVSSTLATAAHILTYTPVNKDVDPDLPVLKRRPDILPLELIGLRNTGLTLSRSFLLALILESEHDESALFFGQEACGLGEIVECPEGKDGNKNSNDSLDDEDPAPSFEAANTVHLCDAKGQKTAECTSDGSCREEEGLSELDFVTTIPHCEVVLNTG